MLDLCELVHRAVVVMYRYYLKWSVLGMLVCYIMGLASSKMNHASCLCPDPRFFNIWIASLLCHGTAVLIWYTWIWTGKHPKLKRWIIRSSFDLWCWIYVVHWTCLCPVHGEDLGIISWVPTPPTPMHEPNIQQLQSLFNLDTGS